MDNKKNFAIPDKWVGGIASAEPVPIVARRILRDRFDAVYQLFPLAARRAHENPEYIHLLRVWTRRSVTAIRLFADFLPQDFSPKAIKYLNRIRRVANAARDCDVLIQRLLESERATSKPNAGVATAILLRRPKSRVIRRWLKTTLRERANQQSEINRLYEKLSADGRLAQVLDELVKQGRDQERISAAELEIAFEPWAHRKMLAAIERFPQDFPAGQVSLTKLHHFRIQCKKLRYTIELLAFTLPAGMIEDAYQELARMQDRLGRVNDLAITRDQLKVKRRKAKRRGERREWSKLKRQIQTELNRSRRRCFRELKPSLIQELKHELQKRVAPPERSLSRH